MSMTRGVMPFLCGAFNYLGGWRLTFSSFCLFRSYEVSTTGKNEEKTASRIFWPLGGRLGTYGRMPESFISSVTAKIRPSIVHVSREKEIGGSGIILDSKGTILTRTHNVWPLDGRTKINVSLPDGRIFLGTILEADKSHGIALLKIQSKIPLPITTLGSFRNCERGSKVISIEHPLRRGPYPRSSSQNEGDEEGDSCMTHDESVIKYLHENYFSESCGGPIVNFDGEVIGISTWIRIIHKVGPKEWHGIIEGMLIDEALRKVGYVKDEESLELTTDKEDAWIY